MKFALTIVSILFSVSAFAQVSGDIFAMRWAGETANAVPIMEEAQAVKGNIAVSAAKGTLPNLFSGDDVDYEFLWNTKKNDYKVTDASTGCEVIVVVSDEGTPTYSPSTVSCN